MTKNILVFYSFSSAFWTYHYKKHSVINERKQNEKEKVLHQTGGYNFKEALGQPYQVTVITAFVPGSDAQFGFPKVKLSTLPNFQLQ